MKEQYGDIKVTQLPRFVVQCEIDRPPNNFFDLALIRDMADCFDELDEDFDEPEELDDLVLEELEGQHSSTLSATAERISESKPCIRTLISFSSSLLFVPS